MRRSGHVAAGSAGASVLTLAALVALVALLSGCDSGSDGPEQPNGGSPSPVAEHTVEPTTPPTGSPSSTTASPRAPETRGANSDAELEVPETGEPPSLEGLRSDDELTVARTMARYAGWMSAHPEVDPDLLRRVLHPDINSDYELLRKLAAYHRENGLWWVGGDSRVTEVEILEETPRTRVVRIHYERDEPAHLVDTHGTVHDEKKRRRWWTEEVWQRASRDDPWRTTSIGESTDAQE